MANRNKYHQDTSVLKAILAYAYHDESNEKKRDEQETSRKSPAQTHRSEKGTARVYSSRQEEDEGCRTNRSALGKPEPDLSGKTKDSARSVTSRRGGAESDRETVVETGRFSYRTNEMTTARVENELAKLRIEKAKIKQELAKIDRKMKRNRRMEED